MCGLGAEEATRRRGKTIFVKNDTRKYEWHAPELKVRLTRSNALQVVQVIEK